MSVRFDDSLPLLVKFIAQVFGQDELRHGVALRDSAGRLSFFLSAHKTVRLTVEHAHSLSEILGNYARLGRVLVDVDEFGSLDTLQDPTSFLIYVGDLNVRLIDRRIVGSDWLQRPATPASPPPRFVFASIKGGVGRSTALSVVAAHVASKGGRVLAIDLDLEAPGLGSILLQPEELPEFGLIDALVEIGVGELDRAFIADLTAPSSLAEGRGRIDVLPAFGRRSHANPADILGKLSRAYLETLNEAGNLQTMSDKIRFIVDAVSEHDIYSVILIDARAGLHETTASSILGLGAEIFLFGLDEPQTFQGYAALLAHLGRFLSSGSDKPEWVERITMVQGKAGDASSRLGFVEKANTLYEQSGLLKAKSVNPVIPLPAGPFGNVPWDDDADDIDEVDTENGTPRETIAVLDDDRFKLFSPHSRRDLLSEGIYLTSYRSIIERVDEALVAYGD